MWVLSAALLLAVACDIQVETKYDQKADFSQYKTFCWMQGCEFTFTGPEYLRDSVVMRYMQNTITEEFLKKGIRYNSADPDLLVDVHVTMETDTAYMYHQSESDYQYPPFTRVEEVPMLKGTFIIDMVDRKAGRMVWRSMAESYFNNALHPDEERIRNGVTLIMKGFPPKKED